eukprot:TRINITY_DN4700_c0_g1_i1.p1 TRINITY_DN4700_c0_g1~~TRINITY_DN4700_c0_g1_i1.p1  ORF type:complete len:349 (-),score=75.18 TRINITY_DN4700_c0_g1_i1:68-1114(-)
MGSDFGGKDGWNMYHGETIPGFPSHPHRGFETITIVRKGLIDHSDSLGAAARFGNGDTQWLTAGKGIVHSEMFPLLNPAPGDNLTELFQIWLNLPKRSKMVPPSFVMLWKEEIPRGILTHKETGAKTEITVVAGKNLPTPWKSLTDSTYEKYTLESNNKNDPPSPPPDSLGSSDPYFAIWTLKLGPGAEFQLPACVLSAGGALPKINRALYFFEGPSVTLSSPEETRTFSSHVKLSVFADRSVLIRCPSSTESIELLLLQATALEEPVAQRGPFVMNTGEEILKAFQDYQETAFGGWEWDSHAPVHGGIEVGRFARHPHVEGSKPKVERRGWNGKVKGLWGRDWVEAE